MNKEINRIHWKCRRGMREIDLLLREFVKHSLEKLNGDQLLLFEELYMKNLSQHTLKSLQTLETFKNFLCHMG